jgi:hypothetical protein
MDHLSGKGCCGNEKLVRWVTLSKLGMVDYSDFGRISAWQL